MSSARPAALRAPAVPSAHIGDDGLALRRAALWGLLGAKILGGWGGQGLAVLLALGVAAVSGPAAPAVSDGLAS